MKFVISRNFNYENVLRKISDKDIFSDDFEKFIRDVFVISYVEYIYEDKEIEPTMNDAISNIMSIASSAAQRLFLRVGAEFIVDCNSKDFHEKMINRDKEILEGLNGQN